MIGGGAFLVMALMGQDTETAFSHSIKLAGGVTAYMIMFGHGLPFSVVYKSRHARRAVPR